MPVMFEMPSGSPNPSVTTPSVLRLGAAGNGGSDSPAGLKVEERVTSRMPSQSPSLTKQQANQSESQPDPSATIEQTRAFFDAPPAWATFTNGSLLQVWRERGAVSTFCSPMSMVAGYGFVGLSWNASGMRQVEVMR